MGTMSDADHTADDTADDMADGMADPKAGDAAGHTVDQPADRADQASQTVLRTAGVMLRGALWPTLVVGAVAIAVSTVLAGFKGALGAVFGLAVVLGVSWLGVAVLRWTARSDPMTVMAAAMMSFFAKIVALGVLLWLFGDTTLFDTKAFGFTILAALVAWLTGEVRGFVQAKTPSVTPARPPAESNGDE